MFREPRPLRKMTSKEEVDCQRERRKNRITLQMTGARVEVVGTLNNKAEKCFEWIPESLHWPGFVFVEISTIWRWWFYQTIALCTKKCRLVLLFHLCVRFKSVSIGKFDQRASSDLATIEFLMGCSKYTGIRKKHSDPIIIFLDFWRKLATKLHHFTNCFFNGTKWRRIRIVSFAACNVVSSSGVNCCTLVDIRRHVGLCYS